MIEGAEQSKQEAGVKYDGGKIGVHLLPWPALQEIAKVLDFGAKKYAAHNWLKGMSWSRLARAAQDHIGKWLWIGEPDEESKLSHLAHAGCCILFLLTYELFKIGTDDRHLLKPDSPDSWMNTPTFETPNTGMEICTNCRGVSFSGPICQHCQG